MTSPGGRMSGTGRAGGDTGPDAAPNAGPTTHVGSPSERTDDAARAAASHPAGDDGRASGSAAEDDAVPLFDLGTALGGRRGIVDASLPGFVLVVVNVAASIWWAVVGAVVTSVLLAVLRVLRREPLRQAVSGIFGIVLAAVLAAYTGKAKNFFLPGILINGAYVVGLLASIAARRPALGYVAAALDRRFAHWRADGALIRRADYATLVWIAVFAVRFVLQGWLYLHNSVGWLATARLALGWPLWGLAVMLSLLLLQPSEPADGPTSGHHPDDLATTDG